MKKSIFALALTTSLLAVAEVPFNLGVAGFTFHKRTPDGKQDQETASLRRTGDFFRKIVVVGGSQQPRLDDDGILYVGVVPFLADASILDSII